MKNYFKEQIEAGPFDKVSEDWIVFYMVEHTENNIDLLRIPVSQIDTLSENYIFKRYSASGTMPIFNHKNKDETI